MPSPCFSFPSDPSPSFITPPPPLYSAFWHQVTPDTSGYECTRRKSYRRSRQEPLKLEDTDCPSWKHWSLFCILTILFCNSCPFLLFFLPSLLGLLRVLLGFLAFGIWTLSDRPLLCWWLPIMHPLPSCLHRGISGKDNMESRHLRNHETEKKKLLFQDRKALF